MIKKTMLASLLFSALNAYAGIASDMENFVNQAGYMSNVTSPKAFESQAAGFMGGGTLWIRNQAKLYQLAHLDMPTYRAGCSGIDLVSGSFSIISRQELVNLGKNVMSSAGAYAVDVMLTATVPQLKDARDFLLNLQQKVNQSTLNSCELAQNLVGGLMPKTAATQKKICADIGTSSNTFSDYARAHQGCNDEKEFNDAMDKASKDERVKKQVVLNKNIVWSMLKDKEVFNSDTELAEMVMSLTGTYIIDKNGKVTNVPSLADSPNLINALIGGQGSSHDAQIWACDDVKDCMSVSLKTITISQSDGLSAKIKTYIESINDSLINNAAPTDAQKGFLSMISFPVLKFLAVLNSTEYGNAAMDIEEYSTIIAQDLLTNYLSELLRVASNSTFGAEFNEDLVKDVQKRIAFAKGEINKLNPKISERLQQKLELAKYISKVEKQVALGMQNAV